jgi:hypothetical protein
MLTHLKLALLISAPLVAGAATYAVAGGHGSTRADRIQKFDHDASGTLDDAERAEMKAAFRAKRAERRAARLARFDADRDGTLDDAERAAMRETKLAERFAALDANGDGAISFDELKAGSGKRGFHRHGRGHGAAGDAGMKP